MIRRDARLTLERLPLSALSVFEYQTRYPEQLMRYVRLLEADSTGADLGLIHVKPHASGRFEILDGHHRFCALVLSGRPDALCLVIDESESA